MWSCVTFAISFFILTLDSGPRSFFSNPPELFFDPICSIFAFDVDVYRCRFSTSFWHHSRQLFWWDETVLRMWKHGQKAQLNWSPLAMGWAFRLRLFGVWSGVRELSKTSTYLASWEPNPNPLTLGLRDVTLPPHFTPLGGGRGVGWHPRGYIHQVGEYKFSIFTNKICFQFQNSMRGYLFLLKFSNFFAPVPVRIWYQSVPNSQILTIASWREAEILLKKHGRVSAMFRAHAAQAVILHPPTQFN